MGVMPKPEEAPEKSNTEELSVRELRAKLGDVLMSAAARGTITYVTHRGRRYAAVVPLEVAEAAERES